MFPFHTWLPDAHTEAPTAGSVILAAIMLKLGAYGFIRFAVPLFPDAAHTFAPVIIVLSLIAIIYGAIVALVQPDLKRLVAYSSVSHMGFVTLGLFVFTEQGIQGAILQMINHGLITGGLFLLVGVIYERTHDRTIAKMCGPGRADPGLGRDLRVLRLRLGRAARPVRLRRRVPDPGRHVRGEPARRGHRDRRHGPGGRVPPVHVRADRVRRGVRVPQGPRAAPDRHDPDRDPDPRPARRRSSSSSVSSPGCCSTLVQGTVEETIHAAEAGAPIAVGPEIVLIVVGLLLLAIVARIGWAIVVGAGRSRDVAVGRSGAAH